MAGSMRGEARQLYEQIREDLIRLHANWQMFNHLYTVSGEQLRLLGDTALGFFRLLQDVLVDNAIVSISRLPDSASYASFARLVRALRDQVKHTVHQELERDLADLDRTCAEIREHRHKRVAHKVLRGSAPMISGSPTTLPPLTRGQIEAAMSAMASIMNKVIGAFESTEQIFEPLVAGDARSLVFYLDNGHRVSTSRP